MRITLKRIRCNGYTIGHLYMNGQLIEGIDTLEDQDRGLKSTMTIEEINKIKVKNDTAIPTGIYNINLDTVSSRFSNYSRYPWAKQFGGKLPRLENVKGYAGVLIHVGNTTRDTEGCILIGRNTIKGKITQSIATFTKLMNILLKYKSEKIELEII